jgi:hypothetical protein
MHVHSISVDVYIKKSWIYFYEMYTTTTKYCTRGNPKRSLCYCSFSDDLQKYFCMQNSGSSAVWIFAVFVWLKMFIHDKFLKIIN